MGIGVGFGRVQGRGQTSFLVIPPYYTIHPITNHRPRPPRTLLTRRRQPLDARHQRGERHRRRGHPVRLAHRRISRRRRTPSHHMGRRPRCRGRGGRRQHQQPPQPRARASCCCGPHTPVMGVERGVGRSSQYQYASARRRLGGLRVLATLCHAGDDVRSMLRCPPRSNRFQFDRAVDRFTLGLLDRSTDSRVMQ